MKRFFIGLMSGTSVDAIDAALVRIVSTTPGQYSVKVLHHIEHPWPKQLRQRLLAVMAPAKTTTEELCQLNALVAQHFAAAVECCLKESRTSRRKIAALGSHGQTVCHLPPPTSKAASTLQLGDPSVLATLTGITTVGNFRTADMAVGGQGAPLVPWTDAILLSHPTKSRVIQNIGGIANVTYLPKAPRHKGTKALREGVRSNASAPLNASVPQCLSAFPQILAFDTGPGNMLLDAVIALATKGKQKFDKNGRLAAQGALDMKLFRKLQAHPYFVQWPPKSTGREDFGQQLAKKLILETRNLKLETLLNTLTHLTAWSIADSYLHFLPALPDEVILCGGGADNPTLVRMLTEELAQLTSDFTHPTPPPIKRIDEFGIPNKAKEAASFALLAAATLDGIPANLPSVTDASHPTLLGVIAPAYRSTRAFQ